jgi:hypothetical protein
MQIKEKNFINEMKNGMLQVNSKHIKFLDFT